MSELSVVSRLGGEGGLGMDPDLEGVVLQVVLVVRQFQEAFLMVMRLASQGRVLAGIVRAARLLVMQVARMVNPALVRAAQFLMLLAPGVQAVRTATLVLVPGFPPWG